jgi:hypothetical protein
MNFDLNGDEAENLSLVGQSVPLLPGRRYRLKTRYVTTDITGKPGFHWSLMNVAAYEHSVVLEDLRAHEQEGEEVSEFVTPGDMTLARLELRYNRHAGTTRPKGAFRVTGINLELLP